MKKQQHIPTLFALLLLVFGLSSFVFVVEKGTNLFTRASANPIPQNILMSNITDNSFSVSWITDQPTNGFITYFSSDTPKQTALSEENKQTTHLITLTGLFPSTTYSFTITSAGKVFNQSGVPYQIQTASSIPGENTFIEPLYGTVKTEDDQPASGTIISVNAPNLQTIATRTGTDGRFVIPLAHSRTQNLSSFASLTSQTPLTITFLGADKTVATVQTILDNTSPLPEVILGKEYNFPNNLESRVKTFLTQYKKTLVPKSVYAAYLVSITQPAQNAGVPSQTPQFKGTGVPDKEVIATVGVPVQVGRVTVNKEGNWSWIPTNPLSPDSYLLTITTTNETNQLTALSRPFTILKSGTQVLDAATPSATPKGTATPSATPITTASPSATPKPLPVSGNLTATLAMISMGFLFIILGSMVIVL